MSARKTLLATLCLVCLSALLLNACSAARSPARPTQEQAHAPQAAPHWTYEGEEGPGHWGDLDPSFAACKTGKSQSPIDLAAAEQTDLPNIVFHYAPSGMTILNNGHTIQVNYDPGSSIELGGERYDLKQFHFHTPSEHSLEGKLYPLELHLVHQSQDGRLAVVGILFEAGVENPVLQAVWDKMPATQTDAAATGVEIDAADFLPAVQSVYRYSGSLTTPPCSEGVTWSVMTSLVQASPAQIAAFEAIFEANNRPVQVLNARQLVEDVTP